MSNIEMCDMCMEHYCTHCERGRDCYECGQEKCESCDNSECPECGEAICESCLASHLEDCYDEEENETEDDCE
jgi:hypothetical protein